MKTTKYLSLAALALMGTLASCQSDDELTIARPDNAVGINVTVGSLQATRSNPASTDLDEARRFNQGDQVCVSTDGQDPVIFQCQNADQQTWAEAVSGKFLLWTQNEMTFKAYYPATDGTSMTAFTLPADQSTEAKIALADYMTRQQTRNNGSGNDISLDLERKTARVIVNIASFTDQYRDDQKIVSNVRINSQYSAISSGNGTGDITAVNPYAQNGDGGVNTTYTALVVPGSGDSGADFITLTDGEGSSLRVKDIPELEAGNSYTFNLTVGKNKILVQSVTVQDWTTGETLTGGQAQEQAAAGPTIVTWSPVGFNGGTYTQDGVTLTPSNGESTLDNNLYDYGTNTFTTTLGKFTKIEIVCTSGDIDGWTKETAGKYQPYPDVEPDNWKDLYKLTWTGDAESVIIQEDVYGIQSITFTIHGFGGQAEEGSASTPLDNATTAWTAGSYAVPAGGLTYSDAITVSGDVTLVLTDGETLTLNKGISLAEGATLTIQGNGTMNVKGTDGNTSSTVGGNHGTLILTSGTLTAWGGNGGSVDYMCYNCSGGNGGDAISGTLTINGGSTSVNDGSNGSIGEECDNCTAGTGGKGHN